MAGHITDGVVGGKWGYGLLAKFYMKKTDIEEAAKEADEHMWSWRQSWRKRRRKLQPVWEGLAGSEMPAGSWPNAALRPGATVDIDSQVSGVGEPGGVGVGGKGGSTSVAPDHR